MRSDNKRYFPFQNAGKRIPGSQVFKNFRGRMPPEIPAELGPPALAPWGTYLFPLKCPSTFRINETPVVTSSSLHDFYLKKNDWHRSH